MIKIVATISDFGAAANIGGNVEYYSEIINVPTSAIPPRMKRYLSDEQARKWATLSFSLLMEDEDE